LQFYFLCQIICRATGEEVLMPKSQIKRKRKRDRRGLRTRVNVGIAFSRWKELMKENIFKRDAEVAYFSPQQVIQFYSLNYKHFLFAWLCIL